MAATYLNWNYAPHNVLVKIFSNLSTTSRAHASATCKTWRDAYLSPCLWDDVQLCYDKACGWEECKKFVSSYGWIFRQVSVFPLIFRLDMFDANGYLLMKAAESYEKALKELHELLSLLAMSKSLRRLQIKFPDDVMGSWGDNFGIDFFPDEVLERIWQSINSICRSSSCMESLELGFHIDIIGNKEVIADLTTACSQTLRKLHCTVADLLGNMSQWCPPSIGHLAEFKKLKEINLNITYITDELLEILSRPDHCQMERIGVLSTCIEKQITDESWTSDSKWQKLKEHSQDLKVTMSLYWPGIRRFKLILKPVIPLQSLSVMCDDQKLDTKFVDYVVTHFKDTLVSLGLHSSSALSLFGHDRFRLYSQPIVALTEQCCRLKKVVVTGFEVFHGDIIAVAERRRDLDILDVAHDSIIYMDPERGDRSSDLGVDWIGPRDNQNESTDERENRQERDSRKVQLVHRVSNALCKNWKPMNRETSAFSYWGFMDANLLPYKEITDGEKLQWMERMINCGRPFLEEKGNEESGTTKGEGKDCKSTDKISNDEGRTEHCGDENVGGENAGPGSSYRRRHYKEYFHAINLAPGLIACTVKHPNKL